MNQYHSFIVRLLFVALFLSSSVTLFGKSDKIDLRPFAKHSKNLLFLDEELPDDFPSITIDTINNPTKGYILMECFQVSSPDANHIMILDESGKVIWYDKPERQGVDFKLQPNGLYSYATSVKLGDQYQAGPLTVQNIYVQHMIMDKDKNIIDSIQMDNEYLADMHDFRILPNGNYLLIAYERVPIDMSKLIPNGNPNATIVGTVIQELDKNKNAVYQWRSLDYVPVLATKDDPRKATFEHVHGNSLFQDKDGNLIVTFPTTFEIVKIDMTSGKLIWRLGGDNNEFEITGENQVDAPYYFRLQHDAKILPNGNLLFYDNAVQKKSGWNSRAVEYELDQINKKANLVWEYKHNPPVSAYAMGSAQRLENGNTLINWGLMFMGLNKGMTEVTPNKDITFELTFPALNFSYRAQKIDLPACEPKVSVDRYEMLKGNTYAFKIDEMNTGVEVKFNEIDAFIYNMMNVKKYSCSSINPDFEGEAPIIMEGRYVFTPQLIYSFNADIMIDVSTLPPYHSADKLVVFQRLKEGEGKYVALETNYDLASNKITAKANAFGEFVIGYFRESSDIYPPKLLYPHANKSFKNSDTIRIAWSATGRYDNFRIQIAEDNSFESIIFDSIDVRKSILYKSDFDVNKEYFWRVQTNYRDVTSEWSNVNTFNFSDPFLSVLEPAGGEEIMLDTTVVIKWNGNLNDTVRVKLLLDGEQVREISTGIFSHFNSISWKVDGTLSPRYNYTIVVESKSNPEIKAESNAFSITHPVSVDNLTDITISSQSSIEVSPNPVSDFAQINLTMVKTEFASLEIFDALGNKQKTIFADNIPEGVFNIPLATDSLNPGLYYCILKTREYTKVSKIVVIK